MKTQHLCQKSIEKDRFFQGLVKKKSLNQPIRTDIQKHSMTAPLSKDLQQQHYQCYNCSTAVNQRKDCSKCEGAGKVSAQDSMVSLFDQVFQKKISKWFDETNANPNLNHAKHCLSEFQTQKSESYTVEDRMVENLWSPEVSNRKVYRFGEHSRDFLPQVVTPESANRKEYNFGQYSRDFLPELIIEEVPSFIEGSLKECSVCHFELQSMHYHCLQCSNFKVCAKCYENKNINHSHSLQKHYSIKSSNTENLTEIGSLHHTNSGNSGMSVVQKIDSIVSENIEKAIESVNHKAEYEYDETPSEHSQQACANCQTKIDDCYWFCEDCKKVSEIYQLCKECYDSNHYLHDPLHSLMLNFFSVRHIQSKKDTDGLFGGGLMRDKSESKQSSESSLKKSHSGQSLGDNDSYEMEVGSSCQHQHNNDRTLRSANLSVESLDMDLDFESECQKLDKYPIINNFKSKNAQAYASKNQAPQMQFPRSKTEDIPCFKTWLINNPEKTNAPSTGTTGRTQSFDDYCCDICEKCPIGSVKFHCQQCQDYDLCYDCYHFRKEEHRHQAFERQDFEVVQKKARARKEKAIEKILKTKKYLSMRTSEIRNAITYQSSTAENRTSGRNKSSLRSEVRLFQYQMKRQSSSKDQIIKDSQLTFLTTQPSYL